VGKLKVLTKKRRSVIDINSRIMKLSSMELLAKTTKVKKKKQKIVEIYLLFNKNLLSEVSFKKKKKIKKISKETRTNVFVRALLIEKSPVLAEGTN
jgi:hypothetical protein